MIYDINSVYLYEVFNDYRSSGSEYDKKEIWNKLCSTIWNIPNRRKTLLKNIGYKILEDLPDGEYKNIFLKYSKISYYAYQKQTSNKNSWYILRQKINNIYSKMCDIKLCSHSDYFYELNTAKRLYFNWINNSISLSPSEVDHKIQLSIIKAKELHNKYSKQKVNINFKQYREIVNSYLLKCLNNYVPLDEFENKNSLSLYIDFWQDDNYIVKYIGQSLNGYMKNYEKEYFGVSRKSGNDKRKYKHCIDCGKLFISKAKSNNIKRCSDCYKKERKRINKNYYNKIKTNQIL